MARIAGVAPKQTARQRIRVPRVTLNLNPLVPLVIFGPIVMVAPDDFIRAISVAVVVLCTWAVGYFEGRAAHARELLDELRRDDPAA